MKLFGALLLCVGFGVFKSFSSEMDRGLPKYLVAGLAGACLGAYLLLTWKKGKT
ncbi:MAG: hypothetical protein ACAH95_06010 [Fimbriimonas sp.]